MPEVQRNAWLMIVLMLGIGLAGCAGGDGGVFSGGDGDDADGDGESSAPAVEPEPGVFVAADRGVLRGTVFDDAGFALSGVRVSILETGRFTDTNTTGRYFFGNVTVGIYQVQFQAAGYLTMTLEAEVRAGNITDRDVTLRPSQDVGAGYRPHVHDLWGERTEVTLLDGPVDLMPPNADHPYSFAGAWDRVYRANTNNSENMYRFFLPDTGGDPPIVFPGTAEMLVTFRWEPTEVPQDSLGFAFRDANGTWGVQGIKASEQTWRVPVTPEMADNGHQKWSRWSFYAYTGQHYSRAPNYEPTAILGPIDVKIVIIKGELYAEPAHIDHWQGRDTIRIRNASDEVVHEHVTRERTYGSNGIPVADGHIVPPGTVRMRIAFAYWYTDAANGSVADEAWVLTWRTGEQPPGTPVADYKRTEPSHSEPGLVVYEYDVAPHETDAVYQTSSSWYFIPSPEGQEDEEFVDSFRGTGFAVNIDVFRGAEA